MAFFVKQDSIVRKIWGNGDTVLFIFAGASAEFALNKAVDWLYFTGRLPSDPLGRLFSTVTYARQIIFSEYSNALSAIDKITAIHKAVEDSRGGQIPGWAYRDVLFMLIDYSIRSFELLERKLSYVEKVETFDVFRRVGFRMGITGLPSTYEDWCSMRIDHLDNDLIRSEFTNDLYSQYRKHLGPIRYELLRQAQVLVVPQKAQQLLSLGRAQLLNLLLKIYKFTRVFKLGRAIKFFILPANYKKQIYELDVNT